MRATHNTPGESCNEHAAPGLLSAGRVRRRRLVPRAVATGLDRAGMPIVFHVESSGTVAEDDRKYQLIGVVLRPMSFFIAIEVVVLLGAAGATMRHHRGLPFRAGARKLRRRPS